MGRKRYEHKAPERSRRSRREVLEDKLAVAQGAERRRIEREMEKGLDQVRRHLQETGPPPRDTVCCEIPAGDIKVGTPVFNQAGEPVGSVTRIETSPSGDPEAVYVTLEVTREQYAALIPAPATVGFSIGSD